MREIVSPLDGIRSPFRTARMVPSPPAAFAPTNLFAASEAGVWYDISDMSSMRQDSTGVTAVTAVEQPVGLLFDKSRGMALGAELITNGTFDTATTGWTGSNATLAIASGQLQVTNAAGGICYAYQAVSTVVGRTYRITTRGTTGTISARLYVGSTLGGGDLLAITTMTSGALATYHFVATGTTVYVGLRLAGSTVGLYASFDDVSVMEVAGIHAVQATASARPTLSARYNQILYSEVLTNAAWTKSDASDAVATNVTTDPIGGSTASRLTPSTTNGQHKISQVTNATAANNVLSVCAKANGYGWVLVQGSGYAWFDVSNGAVGTQVSCTGSITSLGNGWYRCTISMTSATTGVSIWVASGDGVTAFAGNGSSNLFLWGVDLRDANDSVGLPVYQRVGASTDYNTTNFPMYLRFDGVDDWLFASVFNFTGTDKASIIAGLRKQSDASAGVVVELSANISTNNGAFLIDAPDVPAQQDYGVYAKGLFLSEAQADGFAAPDTAVLSGLLNISAAADKIIARRNGVQVGSSGATSLGTGNFGSYPLYIGSRGGSSLRFNGRLYGLIVRGAATSGTLLTDAETWMNGKAKAY